MSEIDHDLEIARQRLADVLSGKAKTSRLGLWDGDDLRSTPCAGVYHVKDQFLTVGETGTWMRLEPFLWDFKTTKDLGDSWFEIEANPYEAHPMSDLSMQGNHHYDRAKSRLHNGTANEVTRAQAEATLALAFEQRTSNLLAFVEGQDRAYRNGMLNDEGVELTAAAANQVAERLGLNV
jgi:hypothetical protein